jgi:hypothetical protein
MHVIVILDCLQEFTNLNAFSLSQFHMLFRQIPSLARNDGPTILA